MQGTLAVVAVTLLLASASTGEHFGRGDQDGTRAVALQQAVLAAPDGSAIELSGTYNFSTSSFLIEGKVGLTLRSGPTTALFLFGYKPPHSDEAPGSIQPGVNITNCNNVSIHGATIDYSPKSPALFCNSRAAVQRPTGKVSLVHGTASVNEMLDGQRLWCGKKPGDKCDFGSFPCPSAAACQARCAANTTCLGATWTHPPGPACYMLSALDSTDPEPGFSSWSRVPVVHTLGPCPPPSGPGITLHMFNSSDTLVEDLTIHAAPYMAITSFNGDGGHVLRRVSFVPNEEGQMFVAERDGVHESDVRRGITLEDSTIGYLNDDFMNIHATMLVVLRCSSASCLMINPHVEGGTVLDTTYAMNSLLEGARAGDTMSFFPLLTTGETKPDKLTPLVDRMVIETVSREGDAAVLQEASDFAIALFNNASNGVMHFAGPMGPDGHVVDVWSVRFASKLPAAVPAASLVSVNEIGSAGARFVRNNFTNTTCSARWKSSNAIIANNSWKNAGHNLEITYLQPWLEGPALISNVSITGNIFHYGAGVNPIHPNSIDTSLIVEEGNEFMPA